MIKELTEYNLYQDDYIVKIRKNNKLIGCGVLGVVSALEAIFVLEGSNKKDWFIAENGEVFKVDRAEWNISQNREELLQEV